jgi:putative endonuclease
MSRIYADNSESIGNTPLIRLNRVTEGITNNLERRLEEHRTGRGAKYTKHRSPLRVRYTEYRGSKNAALTREAAIKSLTRSEKLALIAAQPTPKLHG